MVRRMRQPLLTGAALVVALALPGVGVAHDDPQQVTPGPAVANDPSSTPQFGSAPAADAPAVGAAPTPSAEAQPQQPASAPTVVKPAATARPAQTTSARAVARVTSRTSAPRHALDAGSRQSSGLPDDRVAGARDRVGAAAVGNVPR